MTDLFASTALKLSTYRQKTIVQLTPDDRALCRAAQQLRRKARGQKLGRRLRRKVVLGRLGAF